MKSRGSGAMIAVLLAVFILVPLLEVFLLIAVGRQIGVLPTLGILLAEAIFGTWLMRREGSRAWQALTGALNKGTMPSRELADAALVLLGGALFVLPGFFTDLLGLICLVPFTRPWPRRLIAWIAGRQAAQRGIDVSLLRRQRDTIPGEVIDPPASSSGSSDAPESADTPPAIEGKVL